MQHADPLRGSTLRTGIARFARLESLTLAACGTSYYACLLARDWIERAVGIPTRVELASELRYREAPLPAGSGLWVVSQSGETADTLAALRFARGRIPTLAVVNAPDSAMAREADVVLPTVAGPEIGVASTKAFTAQLVALATAAIRLQTLRGGSSGDENAAIYELCAAPGAIRSVLRTSRVLREFAAVLAKANRVLYVGRGTGHALALEGALKLKEIAYVHAEGFAAGELKHGPLALVEDGTPVVAIAPSGRLFAKTVGNLQEAKARGARLLILTDPAGAPEASQLGEVIVLAPGGDWLRPIVDAVALQLLAYHAANLLGRNVDRPRNLAKSVTVE